MPKNIEKIHHYSVQIQWTGNLGNGTADYKSYERQHNITKEGKKSIQASADPAFRGDGTKWNPEEIFLASISSCHQLWYLHLCSVNNVTVLSYKDNPKGQMVEVANGSGRFTEITLYPYIKVSSDSDINKAIELHTQAHHMCFLANSVNFPITCLPKITS